MDYEKKYNEALERFKTFREKYCTYGDLHFGDVIYDRTGEAQKDLDAIFPELAESEDEQVIRIIKKRMCYDPVPISDEDRRIVENWLEKHKEPIPIPDKFSGLKSLLLQYLQSAANRTNDTEIESDTDLFGRKILDYVWKYDDKQKEQEHPCDSAQFEEGFKTGLELGLRKKKEQKPAEWSEEDNIGWDEAFACVTRAEKAAKNEEELQNAVTAEKWLKEIKFKYYVHPVKQEWSEEDEEKMGDLISLLYIFQASSNLRPNTARKYETWLKSLRPLKKEDWNEHDAQSFGEIQLAIKNYKVYGGERKLRLLRWLDRHCNAYPIPDKLLPRWKPSKEQMDSLRDTIIQTKGYSYSMYLPELYEQLKKL